MLDGARFTRLSYRDDSGGTEPDQDGNHQETQPYGRRNVFLLLVDKGDLAVLRDKLAMCGMIIVSCENRGGRLIAVDVRPALPREDVTYGRGCIGGH